MRAIALILSPNNPKKAANIGKKLTFFPDRGSPSKKSGMVDAP